MKKLILVYFSGPFICRHMPGARRKCLTKQMYSSNFTMADPSYSEKILTLWKDFENNTLDNM